MPPQEETAVIAQSASTGASYWDEPPEDKLTGKTLSTLNLSEVEQSHDTPQEHGPKRVSSGYWDDVQETIQKSLSKLSLSDLVGATKRAVRANEAEKENTAEIVDDIPRRPSSNSFWFWRNPSMSDLQDAKEGSHVDNSTKGEEPQPGMIQARRPSGSGGYWWWNNPATEKLTDGKNSDSQVDLQTLEKNARASDRAEGQKGPISNLQHKMRSTWRASFARLSTNSLAKLDESTATLDPKLEDGSRKEGWRKTEEPSCDIPRRDSFVVHEEDESGMTF